MIKKLFGRELFFCAALGANVNSADEWMKYADKQMRGDRSQSKLTMTIQTPNWNRILEIESDVEGKNLALSTITSPAKEKGIRTLRIGNNMWNYFPKLKRKVSVSSSMLLASWMGSDFTNDDVLKASSVSEDYGHKFLPDEGEYKVIENEAKSDAKVMWPKIISLSSKEDCLPREFRYFDKEGKLRRVMTLEDVKTFEGHKVPTKWTMKPKEDSSKQTVLIYKDMKFSPDFKADHFSQKNLTDN